MSFDYIKNQARFDQKIDFSTFRHGATDIDFVFDVSKRLWVGAEVKVEGVDITRGQMLNGKGLVKDIGSSRPAFFLLCHHDTKASEAITADNLLVSTIWASAPHTSTRVTEFEYPSDKRPTYADFSCQLMLMTNTLDKCPKEPDFIVPSVFFHGDFQCLSKGYMTAARNRPMMERFAQMDSVDWIDFEADMRAFIQSCGYGPDTMVEFVEDIYFQYLFAVYPDQMH
jgi:hypothetical protein